MNTVMQRQSYYFFPLDVDIKDLSEFLNKRIEEKNPCLNNSCDEPKKMEFDDSEPVSQKNIKDKKLPAGAAEDDEEDEDEDENGIIPLRFSEFPVINDALIGGFLTSVVCFILLVVAQVDNPGPNTISMGTGMVYVICSFVLGVTRYFVAGSFTPDGLCLFNVS